MAKVRFWGEQDGPPERELKEHLADLFQHYADVRTAYLANVSYGEQSQINVALCVRAGSEVQQELAMKISEVFASLFGRAEHLDIIFVSAEQEAAVAGVCLSFFPSTMPS